MFLLLLLSQRRPAAARHTCTCIERDNVTLEVTRQQRSCLISHPWLKLLSHHVITSAKQTPKSLLVSILLVDQAGTESVLTVSGALEFTGCSSGRIPSYSLTWTCEWSATIITTLVALQNTPRSCDPPVCWYSISLFFVVNSTKKEFLKIDGVIQTPSLYCLCLKSSVFGFFSLETLCCSVWLATRTWTLGRLGVGIICSSVAAIFTNLWFSTFLLSVQTFSNCNFVTNTTCNNMQHNMYHNVYHNI